MASNTPATGGGAPGTESPDGITRPSLAAKGLRPLDDPSVRAAPPTTPQPFERRTNWPTVIGVLSIVLGIFAIAGSLWNAVGMLMFARVSESMSARPAAAPAPGQVDMGSLFGYLGPWAPLVAAVNGLLACVAVLHLVSGIGVLQRRAWGRRWMLRWAVLKIPAAALISVLTIMMQREQFEAMSRSGAMSAPGAPPPAAMNAVMAITGTLGGCAMLLFYWAMPVFVLVWMNRGPIKKQVAGWK